MNKNRNRKLSSMNHWSSPIACCYFSVLCVCIACQVFSYFPFVCLMRSESLENNFVNIFSLVNLISYWIRLQASSVCCVIWSCTDGNCTKAKRSSGSCKIKMLRGDDERFVTQSINHWITRAAQLRFDFVDTIENKGIRFCTNVQKKIRKKAMRTSSTINFVF